MTIGILAHGPNAGRAVFEALQAVERVGRGAIGGYATFVAIGASGSLLRHETQRGGTACLFIDGEATGVEPPPAVAEARLAAVMSSGPDRPEPLSQFTPADPMAGIVTGHRLPNMPGDDGTPLNLAVLDLMRQGVGATEAVAQVLDRNPNADAGLLAGDIHGGVHARNSRRVARRPDLGHARREAPAGVTVEILHNAIRPIAGLAEMAAEIAIEAMLRRAVPDAWIVLSAGAPVIAAPADRVIVDESLAVLRIETSDHRLASGRWNCAAIYLGAEIVLQNGRVLGRTIVEPNTIVDEGRLISMSGQTSLRIGFRSTRNTAET